MDHYSSAPASLRVFEIQNGLVISETGQQDADDFAADFQGLRHFANRIGATLELGDAHYATFHEPAFSFIYSLPHQSNPKISGAMVEANISNKDLLSVLVHRGH